MICGRLFLFIADDHASPLSSHQHLVFGILKVNHLHIILALSCCHKCGLIHHVFQIRACKSRGPPCEGMDFNILGQDYLLDMHFQDSFPAPYIRNRDHHLPIESPRS